MPNEKNLETIPVGPLGIVALESCKELGDKVNSYIVDWRKNRANEHKETIAFAGYQKDSYLVNAQVPRFGSGEAKGIIHHSVRGDDLFIMWTYKSYVTRRSLPGS